MSLTKKALVVAILFANFAKVDLGAQQTINTKDYSLRLVNIIDNLANPWALAFLPDGRMLITERAGRLNLVQGKERKLVAGLPSIYVAGQSGLMDIQLDPQFKENSLIYFSWSKAGKGGSGTAVSQARLDESPREGPRLVEHKIIFEMAQKTGSNIQYGSRLRFLKDGSLLIAIGDRGQRMRAQDGLDAAGKVHRIYTDGSIPRDNPFVGNKNFLPSIYSWGHRNPQGLVVDEGGTIWLTEHGPQGGDELNIIEPGKNYGWPIITYGSEYVTGAKIGEGSHKEGMEQPLVYWIPSIAPSGLIKYSGKAFPAWRGQFFTGGLIGQRLERIRVDGRQVVEQEIILKGNIGRIRELGEGPDGLIYILTDHSKAGLWRLESVQ